MSISLFNLEHSLKTSLQKKYIVEWKVSTVSVFTANRPLAAQPELYNCYIQYVSGLTNFFII